LKIVRDDLLVFIFRFICIGLMMILIMLFLPSLRLGGRYLILLEALFAALMAGLFRYWIQSRISQRKRSIVTGLSIVITLFLAKSAFYSVNLTIMGILTLYVGVVLLEMILPDRISRNRGTYKKEERNWKH
jgi:hypothetical protein